MRERQLLQSPPYALKSERSVSEHELRLKPEHAVSKPRQARIAARISSCAASMMRTADFDDEPSASADEVADVAC